MLLLTELEQELRSAVVAEAKSWIGTPYHLHGMVKGAGADCATFLLGVLQSFGIIRDEHLEHYSGDWFAHAKEETYLYRMMRHATNVAEAVSYATLEAKPGDIVLTKSANSRLYNHGGIVVKWPLIIHAVDPMVRMDDATAHELWCYRTVVVLDPYKKFLEQK
jgi:cell wall-associated NlpC family hydrolase